MPDNDQDQHARRLAASLHGDPQQPWVTGSPEWVEFSRQFRQELSFYPQDAGDMDRWRWFQAGARFKAMQPRPPGEVDYDAPTPEADAFLLLIDDSDIDMGQVEAQLKKLECERNTARAQVPDKYDLRAISSLAHLVKQSRQNVGQKILDAADSVVRILKRLVPAAAVAPVVQSASGPRIVELRLRMSVDNASTLSGLLSGTAGGCEDRGLGNLCARLERQIDSQIQSEP